MYERKIPDDLNCGITLYMRAFSGKWKHCIVDAINRNIRRPSEIRRYIAEAPARVIDQQLSDLEKIGIVTKTVYAGFPLRVEYYLSDLGKTLLPIIDAMTEWGLQHKEIVTEKIAGVVN